MLSILHAGRLKQNILKKAGLLNEMFEKNDKGYVVWWEWQVFKHGTAKSFVEKF